MMTGPNSYMYSRERTYLQLSWVLNCHIDMSTVCMCHVMHKEQCSMCEYNIIVYVMLRIYRYSLCYAPFVCSTPAPFPITYHGNKKYE